MRRKKRISAGLIALFLGWFGIHRFYLQQPILGFIYIILFFVGIAPILGFIDAVSFFVMSDEKFNRRYNKKWFEKGFLHKNRFPAKGKGKRMSRRERRDMKSRADYKLSNLKKQGLDHFKQYDIEEAMEAFEKALEINSDDIASHFNLACAYSMQENAQKAKVHLATAFQLGFDDFDKIRTHRSLAFLRIQPDWPAFIAEHEQQQAQLPSGEKGENIFDRLKQLAELRQQGVLTEEEYKTKKDAVLQRNAPSSQE